MSKEIGADRMGQPVESEDTLEFGHRDGHDRYQVVASRGRVQHDGGIGGRPLPALLRFYRATQQPDEAAVQEGMQPPTHRPAPCPFWTEREWTHGHCVAMSNSRPRAAESTQAAHFIR
jgi:hypothetical protein